MIMGTSNGHLLLGERARRGRGHVRRRRGRHRARLLRLRGRPVGARRHLRVVHAARRAARVPRSRARRAGSTSTTSSRRRRRRCGRASPVCSRSTGGTGTAPCSSTPTCSGLLVGMTLATRAPEIYRALIEATAFGTRVIVEAFEQAGLPVEAIVACGGLPERNPLADADLRRRHRSRDRRRGLPAGPRARRGDVGSSRRGRGRRRSRHDHRRVEPDGIAERARATRRDPRTEVPTTSSTASTCACTISSVAAATTSCVG